ncbi:hypothetical protein N9B39_01885 [bacterium]|nr:hypothetical protein [bacterium]MDB4533048.1 hypothetical protein [bacterium]
MRTFFLYLLFACTHACGLAQEAKLEIPVELKPEVLLGDGSTYNYQTDFRKWSDDSGKFSVVARFDRLLPEGMVRFRREGTNERIEVKADVLSADDRRLVYWFSTHFVKVEASRKAAKFFAQFTQGWKWVLTSRELYLDELNSVYCDVDSDEFERLKRIRAINKKWQEEPPVKVNFVFRVHHRDLARKLFYGPLEWKVPFNNTLGFSFGSPDRQYFLDFLEGKNSLRKILGETQATANTSPENVAEGDYLLASWIVELKNDQRQRTDNATVWTESGDLAHPVFENAHILGSARPADLILPLVIYPAKPSSKNITAEYKEHEPRAAVESWFSSLFEKHGFAVTANNTETLPPKAN